MEAICAQNYGSTLVFSIVRSQFGEDAERATALPTQKIVRTFDKTSTNLSQYGWWRCIFEETKRHHQRTIELQLSLSWVPIPEPFELASSSSSDSLEVKDSSDDEHRRRQQQQQRSPNRSSFNELIGRIRSVIIRSDSTLSELLVAQLDGGCLLDGEFITVRLQPDRVLRNNQYKFRIGLYTQDISRSRILKHPIFTSFLDIDSSFEPSNYRPEDAPDVLFQFPMFKTQGGSSINIERGSGTGTGAGAGRDQPTLCTIIQAHSSVVCKSHYFAQRVAEVKEERARSGLPFRGIICVITEFSPAVFRTMLRFLYTGRIRIQDLEKATEKRVAVGRGGGQGREQVETVALVTPIRVQPQEAGLYDGRAIEGRGVCRQERRSETVYFEDLYHISGRYGIQELRTLSLKAMQCTLNLSIAVGMLAKLPSVPGSIRKSLEDYVEGKQLGHEEMDMDDGEKRESEEEEEKEEAMGRERWAKDERSTTKGHVEEHGSKSNKACLAEIHMQVVNSIMKEYIQFFATEATTLTTSGRVSHDALSAQERLYLIRYIGDCVLNNLGRLWGQ
ncbi:hypothetical protein EDD11_006101 [Mortierella claussenii]|nr:hypothetical protein EDD11_006101 [Mortierella claussenii]